ncbi:MAG TPA: transcription termination factor NusA [Thermodesulfobacteriota bacterium]|nr:transcription termination factor NusA [Thermodesulfobacteriota bacterium]
MALNLSNIIEQVGKDKGLDKSVLIEALESAMQKAAEKRFGPNKVIEARYNEEAGEIELFIFKTVVEEVVDPDTEISLTEAKKEDPEFIAGDSLGLKLDSKEFGRIDAQTAKQIIIQKMREAERETVLKEYGSKKGEIITGLVQRFERGDIVVDLGRTEAILPKKEQVKRESYRQGERIRGVVLDVRSEARGPQVVISRSHPAFLIKLFHMEVPEVYEGIVEVKGAAREPGERAKIAVSSRSQEVDPVGACVGVKGSRVQAVVQELKGEKIDIIHWADDPAVLVKNALSPAQISKVITDDAAHAMEVVVPDDQLSLAIGKKGQNVRLAAKLTGWKIDITTETDARGEGISPDEALRKAVLAAGIKEAIDEKRSAGIKVLEGIGDKTVEKLNSAGFDTVGDIMRTTAEQLERIEGIGKKKAEAIIEAAGKYMKDSTEEKE